MADLGQLVSAPDEGGELGRERTSSPQLCPAHDCVPLMTLTPYSGKADGTSDNQACGPTCTGARISVGLVCVTAPTRSTWSSSACRWLSVRAHSSSTVMVRLLPVRRRCHTPPTTPS